MQTTKKILFFSESLEEGMGGIASYAHDFKASYPDADITFVTGDHYDGAIHFPANDYSVEAAKRLLEFINKSDADIIVNSGFAALTLVEPFVSERFKVVTVSHFVSGKYAYYAKANAKYCDAIIVLSQENKRRCGRALADKTYVVLNQLPKVPVRPDFDFLSCPVRIVFPGGSNRFKAADIVYKALLRLLSYDFKFEFYWLGDTYIAGRRYFPNTIQDIKDALPDDPRIAHVGPVDREKAKEIIANAHVFLLPSRAEGFPITLAESQSHPCVPIISDSRHGSLDLIDNCWTGFVLEQNDYKGYAELIRDIIVGTDEFEEMAQNALKRAKEMLSPEVWRCNMDKVFCAPQNHNPRQPFSKSKYICLRARLQTAECLDKLKRKYYLLLNFFSYPLKK